MRTINDFIDELTTRSDAAMDEIRLLEKKLEEALVEIKFLKYTLEVIAEPSHFPLNNQTLSLKRIADDALGPRARDYKKDIYVGPV